MNLYLNNREEHKHVREINNKDERHFIDPIIASAIMAGIGGVSSYIGGRQAAKQRKELLGKFNEEETFQRGLENPILGRLQSILNQGIDPTREQYGPQLTELQRQSRYAMTPALLQQQRMQQQGILTPGAAVQGLNRYQRTGQNYVLANLVRLLTQQRAQNINRESMAMSGISNIGSRRQNRFGQFLNMQGQAGQGLANLGSKLIESGLTMGINSFGNVTDKPKVKLPHPNPI